MTVVNFKFAELAHSPSVLAEDKTSLHYNYTNPEVSLAHSLANGMLNCVVYLYLTAIVFIYLLFLVDLHSMMVC